MFFNLFRRVIVFENCREIAVAVLLNMPRRAECDAGLAPACANLLLKSNVCSVMIALLFILNCFVIKTHAFAKLIEFKVRLIVTCCSTEYRSLGDVQDEGVSLNRIISYVIP